MAGGSVNHLWNFPIQPRDLIREGLFHVPTFLMFWKGMEGRKVSEICVFQVIFHKLGYCELKQGLGPRSLDITKGHKSFTLNLLQICFACFFLAQRCSANVGVCSVWQLSKRVALNTSEKCRVFFK